MADDETDVSAVLWVLRPDERWNFVGKRITAHVPGCRWFPHSDTRPVPTVLRVVPCGDCQIRVNKERRFVSVDEMGGAFRGASPQAGYDEFPTMLSALAEIDRLRAQIDDLADRIDMVTEDFQALCGEVGHDWCKCVTPCHMGCIRCDAPEANEVRQ